MRRITCIAFAFLLGSCGLTRPPELNVEDQWADAMRRLGMFSFYPATEDVLPGDIYLLVPPPDGFVPWAGRGIDAAIPWSRPDHDGTRFSLVRLGSLAVERPDQARRRPLAAMSMREHIEEQQRERPRIQPPPEPSSEFVGSQRQGAGRARVGATTGATTAAGFVIGAADQNEIRTRLQRSAIPSLTVARVTETQLGAAGILGNFGANILGSAGGEVGLTIALRDVQELAIEAWRARALFDSIGPAVFDQRILPSDLMYWLHTMRAGRSSLYALSGAACRGDEAALRAQNVQVAVVTRVMYAGSIEYSFSRRASAAVRAALDLQGALAQNIRQPPQIPAVVVNTTPQNATQTPGTTPTPGASDPAEQARNELAGRLSGLTGFTTGDNARAGARTAFGIGTLGALSLVEIFNRPVAVGAGSRLFMTFHDALAGPDPDPARAALRFRATEEECAGLIGRDTMTAARGRLWQAMAPNLAALPELPAPGSPAMALRGPDPFQPDPPPRAGRAAAAAPPAVPAAREGERRQLLRGVPAY